MSNFYWKKDKADIARNYRVNLEIGLIVTLLLLITVFKLEVRSNQTFAFKIDPRDLISIEDIEPIEFIENTVQLPVKAINDSTSDFHCGGFGPEINTVVPFLPDMIIVESYSVPNVVDLPDEEPILIGGLAGLQKLVVYPKWAKKAKIEGRVFVEFIVDENGQILNPHLVRGIGGGCDEAALEAIRKSKFKPGKVDGKPVKVRYSLPIDFKL